MNEYWPDNWVVLKIAVDGNTLYKVLGGWSGGYLDGDSWRMNHSVMGIGMVASYMMMDNVKY